jgi:chromatin remodeling complex protein RSC6
MCITPNHTNPKLKMARTKTNTTASKESAPVVVAVQEPVSVPSEPASAAAAPTKKSSRKAEKAAAVVAVAPVVVEAAEVEAASTEVVSEKTSSARKLADELASLKKLMAERSILDSKFKATIASINKASDKLIKEEAKRSIRKKNTQTSKGGFNSPVCISDALADFMGVSHGTVVTRNVVNKFLHDYVTNNNLRKEGDKRLWVYDQALFTLLGKSAVDEIGYFNLQTHLAPHVTAIKKDGSK